MGLLYEKYASPNELINRMIKTKNFFKFVRNLIDKKNEEAEEEKLWQLYLHHQYLSISYADWKDACFKNIKERQKPSETELKATVSNSLDILEGFNPEQ